MIHVWRYIAERFPLQATLPIAAIIAFGVMPALHGSWQVYAAALSTVWFGLFLLRATDDLHSIDTDRIKSPNRGLVTGFIRASSLRYACLVVLLLIMTLYIQRPEALAFIGILLLYYWIWHRISRHLPILCHPFGSNLIFAALPIFLGLVQTGEVGMASLGSAGFMYFAAIAHEYAHNAGERKPAQLRTYDSVIGARGTAAAAGILFLISFLCGLWMSFYIQEAAGFRGMLLAHLVANMYFIIRLIRRPVAADARKFYILGFTFFLLPLAARIVERLIS